MPTEHMCLLGVDALLDHVSFEANCTVGWLNDELRAVAGEMLKVGDRVSHIGDREIADRCELRAVIAETAANIPLALYFDRPTQAEYESGETDADGGFGDISLGGLKVTIPEAPSQMTVDEFMAADREALATSAGTPKADSVSPSQDSSLNAGTMMNGMLSFAPEGKLPTTFAAKPPSGAPPATFQRSMLSVAGSPQMAFEASAMARSSIGSLLGGLTEAGSTSYLSPGGTDFTLQSKLGKAVDSVNSGRCIIILSDRFFSPVEEIEGLARSEGHPLPKVIDFGLRIRLRISPEELVHEVVDGLKNGEWLVFMRATKSMRLLEALAGVLRGVNGEDDGIPGVSPFSPDPKSRVIVCAEPHPHFPASLTAGCKSVRLKTNFSTSTLMFESIGTSITCRQAATGNVTPTGRKVHMAPVVTVVDIEAREVTSSGTSSPAPAPRVNVSGTVTMVASFGALPGDQFYGMSFAGSKDRVAIASSLGNVYLVDTSGASLASYHLHDAAVWDVDFRDVNTFATGGEDRVACEWHRDAAGDAVTCASTAACDNDVYTIRYTSDKRASVSGGLMPYLTVHSTDGTGAGSVDRIEVNTSVQALAAHGSSSCVACGGGDGSVLLVDCAAREIIGAHAQHSKKAAAIASMGDVVISGSYDGRMRLWDTRVAANSKLQCMKFSQSVTGVAASDNYLAACVGTSLYLWDVRNVAAVLGGHPKAWRDINRAIALDATQRVVATASPDGLARFWSF